MIVGGYTLHLYCDDPAHKGFRGEQATYVYTDNGTVRLQDEFAGHNEQAARRAARQDGWVFRRDTVFCPECMKRRERAK